MFQVIRCSGMWLYDSLSRSYLEFFKAVGLLGVGGWPGAATNELHMFWHERFMIPELLELIVLLFPFLPNLEQAIKELGAAASLSMHAPPSASPAKKLAAAQASQQLRYGSSAVVQVHQGLPVYSATAGAAAGASDSVAQALTGQFDAAQPKKKRPFPELKTFQSFCAIVVHMFAYTFIRFFRLSWPPP